MQHVFLIILIAAAALVGLGMAVTGGIDLCAGAQCEGEQALLESQANQNNATAEQTRVLTEQDKQDKLTFRQHWSKWMTTADQKLGGLLGTIANIMQFAGWIIGIATAFAYVRMANGAATSFNIFMLIRSVVKGVAPVHQRKGKVNSVFMPTANRTLVLHDEQPDITNAMSFRGSRQFQSGDPMTNAARAMSSAHKTRSIVQSGEHSMPFWQTLWHAVLQWRATRSAKSDIEVTTPDDGLFK